MGPEIEVTSAAEGPEIEVISAAEGPEIEMTSAAEGPEIEVISAAECPEIEMTSAAEGSEIEVISDAEASEIEVTSAAEVPKVKRYWTHDSTSSSSSSDSIFRAPACMRCGREADFEPKLVSIGPYHRGRPNLQTMQKTKDWCMSNLLTMRPGDPNKRESILWLYKRDGSNMERVPVDLFMVFESRARSFYKEKFDQISDDEFVQMLLLDSCFVILILLTLCQLIPERMGYDLEVNMGYLEVNIKEVRSDLLLLENQIPLFFLNAVYCWLFPNAHRYMTIDFVLLSFIKVDLPWEYSVNCKHFESDHLLDFYWKSSVPYKQKLIEIMRSHGRKHTNRWGNIGLSSPKLIENATELHQIAGIKFETGYYGQGLEVEFSKGIVRLRCLKINSSLATLLVNLITFENSMHQELRIISAYIKLLYDLIDSKKDVELLQKFGVIHNTLSNHTKVATFFNDIGNLPYMGNDTERDYNHCSDLFRNVKKYYNSSWNRSLASLQNNYFNSPWAGISVFAGVLLLFLASVQTYYTVFPRK